MTAFSQVTLKGKLNLVNYTNFSTSIVFDIQGNPRFYYSGTNNKTPDAYGNLNTTVDTLCFYDLNNYSLLYTIIDLNGFGIYSSGNNGGNENFWILDDMNGNGYPEVLLGNSNGVNVGPEIVDLKTGDVIYSWGIHSLVDCIYVNPSDNTINTLISIWNPTTNTPEYLTYSLGTSTSTSGKHTTLPKKLSLSQNYPNPFNPSTTIEYTLPAPNHVVIQIFNTNGQLIRSLANEDKVTGSYSIVWDGKNNSGGKAASGVYFYSIRTGDTEIAKKMMLLK
jgi:hypothetical protein